MALIPQGKMDGARLADVRLETLDAITTEDEPDLQRTETSTEAKVPVAVVDDKTCKKTQHQLTLSTSVLWATQQTGVMLLRPQELRSDIEGIRQIGPVRDPECRGIEVHKTPLLILSAQDML